MPNTNALTRWIPFWRSLSDRNQSMSLDSGSALASARHALLDCVHDCPAVGTRLLQQKIHRAQSHRELWALRSEDYHCVALQHHQAMATDRLQSLDSHFEGWVESGDGRQRSR